MSVGLLLTLAGLAIVDSTSIGTLFVPIWLLISPGRPRVARILGYLATIALFYFAVGLAIVFGAESVGDAVGRALDSTVALWIQLVVGVGLFALSFRFDPKRRKEKQPNRWRERATTDAPARWIVGLALLAGLAEVATMLPYLGAITLLSTSDVDIAVVPLVLAGYCVVMVVPALGLLVARVAAQAKVDPLLRRLDDWFTRKASSAMGWVLAIAGFLVARDAVARLFFPQLLGN
jgi:cytochrome c biogenesis protein CcdA